MTRRKGTHCIIEIEGQERDIVLPAKPSIGQLILVGDRWAEIKSISYK